ncbi:hypothetical protein GCM10010988_19950 [Cnuibacter physcomitrellae]|nr:discoidin domain-containing protein [Cnuibacter physcomitrellae]GGI38626.1 hypothetical protein GCM10010988_19950 [Cnuibacter physcomitrellae]
MPVAPFAHPRSQRRRTTRSGRLTAPIVVAAVVAAMIPLASVAPAQAASQTEFFSSFESDQAAPFADRVELAADGTPLQQNVEGPGGGSLLGSVKTVTASGENAPNEAAIWAADGNPGTKWLVFQPQGWLQYQLQNVATAVTYSLTSGNDAPERDPKQWVLKGSTDGSTWVDLDTQTNQTWADADRGVKKSYTIQTPGAYSYYKLDGIVNHSGGLIQLADWDLLAQVDPSAPAAPVSTGVATGPSSGYNMKARVGWTGTHSLRYAGEHSADGEASFTNRLFDVDVAVGATSRLS